MQRYFFANALNPHKSENLAEIGKHWAYLQSAPKPIDLTRVDLPEAVRDRLIEEQQAKIKHCDVLDENWDILQLFIHLAHLWRYAPMGGIIGLDWLQAQAWLALTQYPYTPDEIQSIRIIESAAVRELNKDD